MASVACATLLRMPTAYDLLMPQRAKQAQRTTHRPASRAAILSTAAAPRNQLHQTRTTAAVASHRHCGGRRASTACFARKPQPTAPSGKVEEAAAVAAGAYQGLPIVWQATLRLVGVTLGAVIISNLIVRLLNWAAEDVGDAADDASKAGATRDVKDRGAFLRVLEAALVAAHKPVTLLLPAATTILALRETSRWLEILLDLHDDHLPRFAAYTASWAIKGFGMIDDIALAGSKVALAILGFWFAIAWKDRLFDMAIDSDKTSEKLDRILRPISTLLSWALGAVGIIQVLQVVGVNVQPLLAAGGVSGIAIGFGAQKLTQNVLSGAKLFLTQPFVVGERVRLLGGGGGEIVSGIIETIDPMNTIVRKDDGVPVVVPNSVAADCLVANESRSRPPRVPKGSP